MLTPLYKKGQMRCVDKTVGNSPPVVLEIFQELVTIEELQ